MSREYPNRPIVGAGACILKSGKLLLIRRGAEPGKGRWSIPGGLVELGESVEDAMMRETKEEVGLDVKAVKLVDVFDSLTLDKSGRVQYHFVQDDSGGIHDILADAITGQPCNLILAHSVFGSFCVEGTLLDNHTQACFSGGMGNLTA